jgi:hypothetical protein
VYDASKPELGKIPLWRLEREGLLGPMHTGCGVAAVLAGAAVGLWMASSRHDDGLVGVFTDACDAVKLAWARVVGK